MYPRGTRRFKNELGLEFVQVKSEKKFTIPRKERSYSICQLSNEYLPDVKTEINVASIRKRGAAPIYQLQTKRLASKLITSVRRAQNAQSLLAATAVAYEYHEYSRRIIIIPTISPKQR